MSIVKLHQDSKMCIEYDGDADAIYVKLRDGEISKTIEADPNFLLDLDRNGRLLGLEILNVKHLGAQKSKKVLKTAAKQYNASELNHFKPEAVPSVFA